ncbi:hypothetical protein KQI49_00790 [Virgibacillus sp. MSJ-26]|uniref:hypothetical protein n=1 Tax=Virgibacillus sp. MSJ-26 TaxID=2841522 RepID=UPI001C0FF908|nr:hypothetical protein [Virgibacillus sp. MSJ-26]MBU5465362.1 hypothetical protein [Virgibacillus sp. MSJ-26]
MKRDQKLTLVPFCAKNPGKENSYSLFVETQTKSIFKGENKNISAPMFTFLILIFYPFVQFFPIEIFPLDNKFALLTVCSIVMILCVSLGHYLSFKMLENVKKISLSTEEWKQCLKQGNHYYIRQIVFVVILVLASLACFVCFTIVPSRWWFFGGVLLSILTGTQAIILSKTRYQLYKNKLDINLNNGGEEDENITYR